MNVDTYDLIAGLSDKRLSDKTVILCNGVFDILHMGHVEHLLQARSMGERLIVALTDDDYVRKGPGRPLNNWHARFSVLRELRCVDQVMHSVGAVAAIRFVRPHIFVKGIDYAGGDRWTEDVVAACADVGAAIRYTTTPKMSATELIKRTMEIA